MNALLGKRVALTRASHQSGELETLLRKRGALVLPYPCIAIVPPDDLTALNNAIRSLDTFDWLILTSANTAWMLHQQMRITGLILPPHLRVVAVGSATARAAREWLGAGTVLIPNPGNPQNASALVDALGDISGGRVLLPQSEIADISLQASLITGGAQVTRVDAYRTVIGSGGVDLPLLLKMGLVDAVTFTSPSTVQYFMQRFQAEGGQPDDLKRGIFVCIGRTTAQAAREAGFSPSQIIVASRQSAAGLAEALEDYFTQAVSTDPLYPYFGHSDQRFESYGGR